MLIVIQFQNKKNHFSFLLPEKLEDVLNKSPDAIAEAHGEHNGSVQEFISKTEEVFRDEKE